MTRPAPGQDAIEAMEGYDAISPDAAFEAELYFHPEWGQIDPSELDVFAYFHPEERVTWFKPW